MTQLIILSLEYMYCQCRGAICLWVTGWNLYKECFVLEIVYLEIRRTKRSLIFKTALCSLFCLCVLFVLIYFFLERGGGGQLDWKVLIYNYGMRLILLNLPNAVCFTCLAASYFFDNIYINIRVNGLNIESSIGW